MTSTAPPPAPEFPERPEAVRRPPPPSGPATWPTWVGPVGVLTALMGAMLAGLVVAVIAAAAGADVFEAGADPPPGVVIAGAFAQGVIFIGAAIVFARLSGPVQATDFGLRPTPFWRALGITIGLYVAFVLAAAAWWALVGAPGDEELLDALGVDEGTVLLVLAAITVCLLAPLGEEFLFRGFLFPSLRNGMGVAGAAIATGLIFGGIHAFSSPVENLLPLAVLGAVFCLIYQLTGSLYPCIALHAMNNAIAFGTGNDWDWQILPLVVAGVTACLGVAMLAARLWRPRQEGRAAGIPN